METYLIWLIVGVAFILLEFIIPGFFVLFIGVAALVVSLLNTFIELNIFINIIIMSALSVGIFFVFRNKYKEIFTGNKNDSTESRDFIGKRVKVIQDISPSNPGKVELHGTIWKAISEDKLNTGDDCLIINEEDLKLKVSKIIN